MRNIARHTNSRADDGRLGSRKKNLKTEVVMSCFTCEHLDEKTEKCLKLKKLIYKYQEGVKLYVCPIKCEHFIDTHEHSIFGD
jgi:hypothetical protein